MDLSRGFRLGEWLVLPQEGRIVGARGKLRLQPKSMDVLLCLADRAREVVAREDILEAVWGERAVSDEPLTRSIGELRRKLGDSRDQPTYIETIPKRGYRLLVAVAPLEAAPPDASPVGDKAALLPPPGATLLGELQRRKVLRIAVVYAAVAWGLTLVAEATFPGLGIPAAGLKIVQLLALLGFPVAVILAWDFEITPDGIMRDHPARFSRTLHVFAVLWAVGVVGWGVYDFGRDAPDTAWKGSGDAPPGSVAVLPFLNIGDDPENAYFADGLAEELLGRLADIPGLRVPSRTSAFAFRDPADLSEIAEALTVNYVVEGSVRRAGDRVRVTAQLVDVTDNRTLWTDIYERNLDDIFAIQEDIASNIAQALHVTLDLEHSGTRTRDVEAFVLYLQARHLWAQRRLIPVQQAIEYYRAALQQDPTFARAWADLAAAYFVMPAYSAQTGSGMFAQAAEAARRALELDPSLGKARSVLTQCEGVLTFIQEGRIVWEDLVAGLREGVALAPNDPDVHLWYGMTLQVIGFKDEALEQFRAAQRLDPMGGIANSFLAAVAWSAQRHEEAVEYARRAQTIGHYRWSTPVVVKWRVQRGEYEEAEQALETFLGVLSPGNEALAAPIIDGYRNPANAAAAGEAIRRAAAAKARFDPFPFLIDLGLWDEATESLKNFFAGKQLLVLGRYFDVGRIWDAEARPLRRDPRFLELLDTLQLPTYWRQTHWPPNCTWSRTHVRCN